MSSYYEAPLGYTIHYTSAGNTSGQLAICLHGLGGSTETYAPLMPFIPPSFHVVCVDFPGFGKSPLPKPPRRVSIEDHVTSLHHLIAFLLTVAPSATTTGQQGQNRPSNTVVFLGHSMGGIVALQHAALYPDVAAGLFLLGPGRSGGSNPAARKAMLELAAQVRQDGIEAAAAKAAKSNFYNDTPERMVNPELRQTVYNAVAASNPEGYAQTCEALVEGTHTDPDYSQIGCPVVFVAGDMDIISPLSRSQELAALVRGEADVEVVRSGHQPLLEDLHGVKKAFELFLEKAKK